MRKNQPRIGANPPYGRDNRICYSSLSQVSRKPSVCSAKGEPVRKSEICSPPRVYDPRLTAHPASTCSSLHRERSGKSCRRPSGSCGRKRFFYYISGCGAATVGRPFRGGLSRASPGGKRKGLATPALRRIDGAAGDLSRASR